MGRTGRRRRRGGLTIGIAPSFAHQCPDGDTTSEECHDRAVYPDWRGNYVPLFDLPDREGVWGTPAVDVDANLVIFGTGSCPVDDPDNSGSGENALSLDDGAFRWRFAPPRPYGSRTDDDFGSSPQLFEVDGTLVAGAGSKDGTYYALDARTGSLHWAAHVGQSGHTYEDFAVGGIIGTPAVGESRGAPSAPIRRSVSPACGPSRSTRPVRTGRGQR